jgi:hypothetical protein
MKKIPTEKISKDSYVVYLEKASEFDKLMKYAEGRELWNGVGLNAVHCAISACDSLTAFYLGERSKSQRHEDILILIKQIPIKNIDDRMKQLAAVLAMKNLVEYEAREFHKEDAVKIAIQAERFYLWVKDHLPQ